MGAIGRIQRTKKDILPFTDHLWMVYKVRQACPLPWLYSFAMYLTPKEEDANRLLDAIRQGTHCTVPCQSRPFNEHTARRGMDISRFVI